MVRLQGDFAKPPEKRFNYKHSIDALYRVSTLVLPSCATPIPFVLRLAEPTSDWRYIPIRNAGEAVSVSRKTSAGNLKH